jgi:hypothetical protein
MRIACILPLLAWCLAASMPQARGEGFSPFGWLSGNRAETTNVSGYSKTPTVLAKMKGGTQRFVNGTKDLFVAKKPPVKTRGATGTRHAKRPEPPKQSFFKRWFNPEPPPPPRTVDEWMKLDQIHP